MAARPPSIVDVAAIAGVSRQTVSRVLNDHPAVREQTRTRVREAIEQLGYRPNMAARSLASRNTFALGVVVSNPHLFGPSQALLGVEEAGRHAGYWVGVAMLGESTGAGMTAATDRFSDQGVDGVVVIAPNEATLQATSAIRGLPLVVVTSGPAVELGLVSVDIDQRAGAQAAMRHLIGLGHRWIAHVGGPDDEFHAMVREQVYHEELRAAGLDPLPVVRGDWSPAAGYTAGKEMARSAGRPSAIFSANDQMAIGLIRGLWEAGVRVPEDVAVVGVDDIVGAEYLVPPLTTVRQDFGRLGVVCVELLLAVIRGEQPTGRTIRPELMVRASTRVL